MLQPTALYSVEREFETSIEDAWHAWTESAQLEQWYHGTEHSVVPGSMVSEPQRGGIWTVAIDVPQFNFVAYFWGQYISIEPQQRIQHTMHYGETIEAFVARGMNGPAHTVVVDFEQREDKIWIRFSQFGEMPAEQAVKTKAGMESYFDSLEAFLGSSSARGA